MTIYLPEWMYGVALAASAVGLLWFVPAIALRRSGRLSGRAAARARLAGLRRPGAGAAAGRDRADLRRVVLPGALPVRRDRAVRAAGRVRPPGAGPGAARAAARLGCWSRRCWATRCTSSRRACVRATTAGDADEDRGRAAPANVEARRSGEDFRADRVRASSTAGTGTVLVTLYWRALGRPRVDYTAFVHLIDRDGNILAQKDQPPGRTPGSGPTSGRRGDVVSDPHAVAVRPGRPPTACGSGCTTSRPARSCRSCAADGRRDLPGARRRRSRRRRSRRARRTEAPTRSSA